MRLPTRIRYAGPALLLAFAAIACPGATNVSRISFSSSGVGAVFHVMVGGFAPYASEHLADIEVTAEATRGSVENVRLISSNRSEMAFVAGTILYQAAHQQGLFEEESHSELRGVSVVYTGMDHWVTRADSAIHSMEQLRNKRVSIGPPGSSIAATALVLLEALDIAQEVEIRRLGTAESATALRDSNIDAFAVASAPPVPSVVNLAATHDIRILPVDPEIMQRMMARSPANFPCPLPAGTYRGVDTDLSLACYEAYWVVHENVAADLVYRLLRFAYSPATRKYLEQVHPGWKSLSPGIERMTNTIGVPLHPGARKYYREIGILP